MPNTLCNNHSCLIPKELFKEERIQEYWNLFFHQSTISTLCFDNLGDFVLIYPKLKDKNQKHDITSLYKDLEGNFPHVDDAICLNIYENFLQIVALKNKQIQFSGKISFSVSDELIYHLANIYNHFFTINSKINIYYQQIPSKFLRLLNKYFELKKI